MATARSKTSTAAFLKAQERQKEVQNMQLVIARYNKAVREHETRGSLAPEDVEAVVAEFEQASCLLNANVGYLINKAYQ